MMQKEKGIGGSDGNDGNIETMMDIPSMVS